jgi:hypothetical protein
MLEETTYTAFVGDALLVSGALPLVVSGLKSRFDKKGGQDVLVFRDDTGGEVDFDLTGTMEEVLDRLVPKPEPAGRGRPKLGVVSREVSLLPRHWEWLDEQPHGNSAALRRLIDEARKKEPDRAHIRKAHAAASRVMSTLAGNLPGFEEASRALFARDEKRFRKLVRAWPGDVRKYLARLLTHTWLAEAEPEAAKVD